MIDGMHEERMSQHRSSGCYRDASPPSYKWVPRSACFNDAGLVYEVCTNTESNKGTIISCLRPCPTTRPPDPPTMSCVTLVKDTATRTARLCFRYRLTLPGLHQLKTLSLMNLSNRLQWTSLLLRRTISPEWSANVYNQGSNVYWTAPVFPLRL